MVKHTVNLSLDLKFRSNISYSGFQPGIYFRYAPAPFLVGWRKLYLFGESNYHISSSVFKKTTEPYASDIGLNAGLCFPFELSKYHQLAIELCAETEWVFYNSTSTCYFYPELGLNYYITIPRTKKRKEVPVE